MEYRQNPGRSVPVPIKSPPPPRLQVVKIKKKPNKTTNSAQAWRTRRLHDSWFVCLATSRVVRLTVGLNCGEEKNITNAALFQCESPKTGMK